MPCVCCNDYCSFKTEYLAQMETHCETIVFLNDSFYFIKIAVAVLFKMIGHYTYSRKEKSAVYLFFAVEGEIGYDKIIGYGWLWQNPFPSVTMGFQLPINGQKWFKTPHIHTPCCLLNMLCVEI